MITAAKPAWFARTRPRSYRGRRRMEGLGALGVYLGTWLLLVGRHAVLDPAHTCACRGNGDPTEYLWSFVWWPHAIAHGLNPFFTDVIWAPTGGNVAASAIGPGPSLLLAPITEAFGPMVSYNLLSLLAPALAAWFTFRLCRYLTGAWLPSLVAGYIFGFSSYEIAASLDHLNLMLVFLAPAAVHLVLLRLDRNVSARRFVVLMGCIFVLQYLLSAEILVTMLEFGAVALALGYVFSAPERRRRIRAIVPRVLLAGAAAALVVGPFLYYAFKDLGPNPAVDWFSVGDTYSADPLNYVLPTPVTWLGHGAVGSLAAKFNSSNGGVTGNYSESGAYVGVALLAIAAFFLISNRRRPAAKVLFGMLVVVFVASLGPHLHVASPPHQPDLVYHPSIPLPGLILGHIPGLDRVSPVRLSIYIFLSLAVITALWLAQPSRRSWLKWLLAAVAVVSLLPNPSASFWRGRPANPKFFTSATYERYLRPGEVVLAFPFGYNGNSLLWQAQTHMSFRLAGGYRSSQLPMSYWRELIVRNFLYPPGQHPLPKARVGPALREFVKRRRVGAIIVGPGDSDGWPAVLAGIGLRGQSVDGVRYYPVPPAWLRK